MHAFAHAHRGSFNRFVGTSCPHLHVQRDDVEVGPVHIAHGEIVPTQLGERKRPRAMGRAGEQPLDDQPGEVRMDGARRTHPQRGTQLPHRRAVPARPDMSGHGDEDVPLAARHPEGHEGLRSVKPRGILETVARMQSRVNAGTLGGNGEPVLYATNPRPARRHSCPPPRPRGSPGAIHHDPAGVRTAGRRLQRDDLPVPPGKERDRPGPVQGLCRARIALAAHGKWKGQAVMNETKTALLVLDLDGTVRKGFDELGRFVNRREDVEVFPEAVFLMRAWKQRGGRVIAVSNQGGIALGHVTMENVALTMVETQRQCEGLFDKIAWCQHHPEAKDPEYARCWCRKPAPGLVIESALALAQEHHEYYPPHLGLFVGDRPEDEECARICAFDFMPAAKWRESALRKGNW